MNKESITMNYTKEEMLGRKPGRRKKDGYNKGKDGPNADRHLCKTCVYRGRHRTVRLYVWQEYTCNKRSNRQTADELIRMGITGNDLLTCDSAEKKSIGDYKSYGLLARAAEKGPGSREYSYKWLQSLREIIIDNVRCPVAAQEFMDYEYERDKEGNIITGYPDGNDHMIDAVRYATERIWKRRGE